MRILVVSDIYLPTVSGVATSTDSIARYMAAKGHQVYLVCPHPLTPYDPPKQQGLEFVFTPRLRDPFFDKPMTVMPLGFWQVWQTISKQQLDIVHIQEPGALGIMALILAKIYRIPVVGAMHFSLEQVSRMSLPFARLLSTEVMKLYIRVVYPQYNEIMVPTKTAANNLVALIGRSEQIHPISNGVDTTVFAPQNGSYTSLRNAYHIDTNHIYFLYLGRLDVDKNIETMFRALTLAPQNIRFIVAGVGTYKQTLVTLAKQLSISDRIDWVDQIDQQKIIDLYKLSDGFVIMSTVETQSIVALQALACGLPLVAANAGALPELVRDGINGYLLPPYDHKALAQKMTYLARQSKVRKSMGEESRTLSKLHEKQIVLKKLELVYKEVAK
jgi:1,2-diacylglycerol 3-alpha-glucosyltransferase